MGVESMGMNYILITAYIMTPFGGVVNMSKVAQFKVVVLEM
jgi:hypothetical protein